MINHGSLKGKFFFLYEAQNGGFSGNVVWWVLFPVPCGICRKGTIPIAFTHTEILTVRDISACVRDGTKRTKDIESGGETEGVQVPSVLSFEKKCVFENGEVENYYGGEGLRRFFGSRKKLSRSV